MLGKQANKARWTTIPEDLQHADTYAWTIDEVVHWLQVIGCEGAEGAFREHHVNGAVLLVLTDGVLRNDLGIKSFGMRNTILLARDWLLAFTTRERRREHLSICPPTPQAHSFVNLSPASRMLGAAKHAAIEFIENTTAENLMMMKPMIYVSGAVVVGGLALIIAFEANPWWLLWLGTPLFYFLMLSMQRITHH